MTSPEPRPARVPATIHRALSDAAAADMSTVNLTQPGEPIVLRPIMVTAIPAGVLVWLDEPDGSIVGNLRLTRGDAEKLRDRLDSALEVSC